MAEAVENTELGLQAWWRYNSPSEDVTQAQLADELDVSQPTVSRIVSLDRAEVLEAMDYYHGLPPEGIDRAYPDGVRYEVAFEAGYKWSPWHRDLGKIDRHELQTMVENVAERVPPFYEQRRSVQEWERKRAVLEETSSKHFCQVSALRAFLLGRSTKFMPEIRISTDIDWPRFTASIQEPKPDTR